MVRHVFPILLALLVYVRRSSGGAGNRLGYRISLAKPFLGHI